MTEQSESTTGISGLWQRLRSRKLIQWAAVYVAGAWLIVQIADTIGPRWGLTESMARLLDIALVFGFFAALIIAWYHGEKGRQRVGTVELLMLGVLLVIGGATLELLKRQDAQVPTGVAQAPEPALDTEEPALSDREKTIAVLPFDNFSPDPNDAYFAAGITEEITSQLANIGDLTVLSRAAVESAIESNASLESMAASLGAGSVLDGSVRMAGQQVRITAQLIDMSSRQNLWTENFDRELKDIFGIQTEVALAIGNALLARLSSGERRRIEAVPTKNVRAYQLYLRNQSLFGNIPEENNEGIKLLEQALELDPGFAAARARLAWRYVWLHRLSGDFSFALKAEQIALRAIEDGPDLGYTHYVLGSVYKELDRFDKTQAAFRRAYELEPHNPDMLTDISMFESTHGSIVTALEMGYRSVQYEPNTANTRWHAAYPLLATGDLQRVRQWLDLAAVEGLEMHRLDIQRAILQMELGNVELAADMLQQVRLNFPNHPEAFTWSRGLLVVLGKWRLVEDEILTTAQSSPNVIASWSTMPRSYRTVAGFVLAESGKNDEAMALFEQARALNKAAFERGNTFFYRWVEEAAIHAYLGEIEPALSDLERAIEGDYLADAALRIDPMFANLQGNPRFEALLDRIIRRKTQRRNEALAAGAFEPYDRLIRSQTIAPSQVVGLE